MIRTFSTLGCPDHSLVEVMAVARRHGITALELRALGGTVDLPAYFQEHYKEPARLAEAVAAEGLRVVALDTSFRLLANTHENRGSLAEFLPWAEALGGVNLRIFDGGTTLTDEELGQAVETMHWWRERKAEGGWRSELMVETHDALVTTAALRRCLKELGGELGLLWDAHHTWRKGGEDPLVTWSAIRAGVRHIHVKDSVDRPSARHPFTYVLPGNGEFPMRSLLRTLHSDGFLGAVSLEWELKWHPYLPPLEEALRVASERGWW